MRIAFVSTILGYPWGGADTLWTSAAQAASARGDQLLLSISDVVASDPRIRTLINSGAQAAIRNPVSTKPTLIGRFCRKFGLGGFTDALLIAAIRRFRPDLVIFSQGGTYDLIMHLKLIAWLRSCGIRYQIIANWQQERPQLDPAQEIGIGAVFRAADTIYFVSTRNLAITRRHLGLPLTNAKVIQNPLRWQQADVSPWPDAPVGRLATVSRLENGKGIHLLLQALLIATPDLPPWQLNIYGLGPQEAMLRELADHPDLRGSVHFCGYVKSLREIWSSNQLMVSPALEDGVPMTIPEAMLCQRPVLATCVGGAEDWVVNGQTGFLCATPEIYSLAASIRAAFAMRDHWSRMGVDAAAAAANIYRPQDYLLLIS
jgi:glycosyltransferase involved in cell wall biosynthesis